MIIGIIVILVIALLIAVITLHSMYANEAFATIEKSNKGSFLEEMQKYAEVGYYPISDCVIDSYGNYKIHLKKDLKTYTDSQVQKAERAIFYGAMLVSFVFGLGVGYFGLGWLLK
ncbi:hypothetical protein T36_0220 [Helicobacter cinaedi]|uniref:hypothetical protein n=1 Tax=Helicobacter cinaedi TaxID=213 RepID=UPI001F2B5C20|nr:hypothetical protein [Helicobacter cinaedi]BDB63776.1 hypothetical protein T36_0220 [Helicobacter cinaedi]